MQSDIPKTQLKINRQAEIVRQAPELAEAPAVRNQQIQRQYANIVVNIVANNLACHGI